MLAEGMGLRATAQASGVARVTVEKLLRDLGEVCGEYQDRMLRNLACRRVNCDDIIWSFVYARQQNVERARRAPAEAGDIWTWIARCGNSMLIPTWRVGQRDASTGLAFVRDVLGRLRHRMRLTANGQGVCLEAVEAPLATEINEALIREAFGPEEYRGDAGRPSERLTGRTSVDRMTVKRFTREHTGFSKKLEMHLLALAFQLACHNFVKPHRLHRSIPAVVAGVTDRPWGYEDLVRLLEEHEAGELRERLRARQTMTH